MSWQRLRSAFNKINNQGPVLLYTKKTKITTFHKFCWLEILISWKIFMKYSRFLEMIQSSV